jgi:transcriptional regulator GlxA family with amidase domain
MNRSAALAPVSVALLVTVESTPSVLYGMSEVFSAVGRAWEQLTGEPSGARRIEPRFVAATLDPVTTPWGTRVLPDACFEECTPDVVLVTDLAVDMTADPRGRWPAAARWIRQQYECGAVIGSVCTGSVLLADTGLLDGRPATTHWSAGPLFHRWYPEVELHEERMLVPAGPEHRVITSGGYASWADLVLYLIARFCGREEAVRIAKIFILGDRGDGQLPYSSMIRPTGHGDGTIEHCQEWIAHHYAAPNPVRGMQARSGLPERTFKRRFRAATGYTPIEYVQTLRIEEAKHELETGDAPVDEVAAAVGYQDSASFRRLFKRMTGVTPARYRQRFASIGVAARATAVG